MWGVPVSDTPLETSPNGMCPCVSEHAPSVTSYDNHHIIPVSWGGENGPRILLCPTAHRNAHDLLNNYVRYGGKPPGQILRRYSLFIRGLAEKAWENRPSDKPPWTSSHGEVSHDD